MSASTPTTAASPYSSLSDSLGARYLSLLMKGPPGAGKTTKAAYFPRPCFFNFDNNLSGLRKLPPEVQKRIKIVNPRLGPDGKPLKAEAIWKRFVDLLEVVLADPEVDTVIIDSLTTMAECLMDKILGSGDPSKRVEIQHWGDFQRYLKWLGEEVLCAPDRDKHIVFLAHEVMERDDLTSSIQYVLNIGGSLKTSYDLFFTDCWRVYTKVNGEKIEYRVRTLPATNFNAKCSLDLPVDFAWDTEKDKVLKLLEVKK